MIRCGPVGQVLESGQSHKSRRRPAHWLYIILMLAAAPAFAAAQPKLTITTTSLPPGSVGFNYTQTLTATGGVPPYQWSITSGSLPPGLQLDPATGTISGTLVSAGSFSFTVRVRDANNATASQALQIMAVAALSVTTASLPNGAVGAAYSQQLSATGGTTPYSWSVASGALPPGLSLSSGGSLTGTPTTAGTFNFTVQVKDSQSTTTTASFAVTIAAPAPPPLAVTTASLPGGTAGAAYSQTLAASGGSGGYTWSVVSGSLPAGLSLNPNGAISGTPSAAGTANFTVQVKDSANATATAALSIAVSAATPPLSVTTTSLPGGTVGSAYSQTLAASGGTGGDTWSVTSGSLPAGLSLNANGTISGTPSAAGTANFTVQVKDSANATATAALSIAVTAATPPLIITTTSLPGGAVGSAYSQALAASGGAGGYTWSITSGSLPAGLSLNANGTISGTPSAAGTANFAVQVKDSGGATAAKALSIGISQGQPALSLTTTSLPGATAGASYNFSLTASGGRSPYSWTVTQGALPSGLSLNGSSGVISGVPSAQGTFNLTIQVADAASATASRALSLTVAAPSSGPALSVTGISGTLSPLQQPAIGLAIASPFPLPISGQLHISFTPSSSNPMDDASIQFSTGGRTAAFTIAANGTQAAFGSSSLGVQVGSVAGTISFTVDSLQAGGVSLPSPGGPLLSAQVSAGPPVIRSVTVTHTSGGFQADIVGYSTTRELTQATVSFHATAGSNLQTTQVIVPLGSASSTWFQSSSSAAFGGQFTVTLPFTFAGGAGGLDTVSVVLTNSDGNSQASSATY